MFIIEGNFVNYAIPVKLPEVSVIKFFLLTNGGIFKAIPLEGVYLALQEIRAIGEFQGVFRAMMNKIYSFKPAKCLIPSKVDVAPINLVSFYCQYFMVDTMLG